MPPISLRLAAFLLLLFVVQPTGVQAQITVLDQAQDGGAAAPSAAVPDGAPAPQPRAPAPVCGTKPITIAEMSWSSAAILAEIHARLLTAQFHCTVQVVPGDMAAIGSSMGSATGQAWVAPELWVTRIAEVWNAALQAQTVRPATSTYTTQVFEGWFWPDYVIGAHAELGKASGLKDGLPAVADGKKVRFITCPADWACALINTNLIAALGIADQLDVVVPSNRFEMDTLIGEAVSKKQPVLFYYWQPNAILQQFAFKPVDLGAFDATAAKCLAQEVCAERKPSAFSPDTVVVALSEQIFTDLPLIAAYFQRSSLPLEEMNSLLGQLNAPGATPQSVADNFVATRAEVWKHWVGETGE